jgi:hypothetical protein
MADHRWSRGRIARPYEASLDADATRRDEQTMRFIRNVKSVITIAE